LGALSGRVNDYTLAVCTKKRPGITGKVTELITAAPVKYPLRMLDLLPYPNKMSAVSNA